MTLARYSDTLRDQNGRPIEGALVSVLDQANNLAALQNDDASTLQNPFETDETGAIILNAEAGYYTFEYRFGGEIRRRDSMVAVGVPVVDPALATLGGPTGAAFIGSLGPSNVQTDLNARVKSADLANPTLGAKLAAWKAGYAATIGQTVDRRLRDVPTSLFAWASETTIGVGQDCTSIVQTAVNDIAARGGGTLLLSDYANGAPLDIALNNVQIPQAVAIMTPTSGTHFRLNIDLRPGTTIRTAGAKAFNVVGKGAVLSGFTIIGSGGTSADDAITFDPNAWFCAIRDVAFDQIGRSIIKTPAVCRSLIIDNIFAANTMKQNVHAGDVGVIEMGGTDHVILPSEWGASMFAMANPSPRVWGLLMLAGADNITVAPGSIVEFCEAGIRSRGYGSNIMGVRSDFMLHHGFAGQGTFTGCHAEQCGVSGDGSAFKSLGENGMHLIGCKNNGPVDYAFDFLGSDYSDLYSRGSATACHSNGHTVSKYRRSTTLPTPILEAIAAGTTAQRPTETWAGLEYDDVTLGRRIIRNGANSAWVGVVTEAV